MAPSLSAAAAAAAWLASAIAKEVPGCFYYNFENEDPNVHGTFVYEEPNVTSAAPVAVVDALTCQALCLQSRTCAYFTLYPAKQQCWLHNQTARLTIAYGQEVTVVGPRECPQVAPLCTELPGSKFPASTPEDSMAAWPTGFQPRKSVCWRRVPDPVYYFKADPCLPVRVLTGLQRCEYKFGPVTVEPLKTCKDMCIENPLCASWKLTGGVCYNGLGLDCRPADNATQDGERIARGHIRKLADLAGVRFDPPPIPPAFVGGRQTTLFERAFGPEVWPTLLEAVGACREVCYSYLGCQYWQYDNTTGCFVDTSGFTVELVQPLTTQYLVPDVPTVVAGEYIQHLCGVDMVLPKPGPTQVPGTSGWWPSNPSTSATTSDTAQGLPFFGPHVWLIAVVFAGLCLLLLCCAMGLACLTGAGDDEDKGGRRRTFGSIGARRLTTQERLPLMQESAPSSVGPSMGPSPRSDAPLVPGQVVPTFGVYPQGYQLAVQGAAPPGVLVPQVPQYVMQPPTYAAGVPTFQSGVSFQSGGSWVPPPVPGLQPPVLPQMRLN